MADEVAHCAQGKAEHQLALEVAMAMAHAFEKKDFETMKPLLHDDFRCTIHGDPDIGAFLGTWDKESLFECLKTHWEETFGDIKYDDEDHIAMGNKVAQFLYWSATANREQPIKLISILKYVVTHGLIHSIDCHMDSYVIHKEGLTPTTSVAA